MVLLLLHAVLGGRGLELALALERQHVVLEHHLDVFALHVGQFRLQHELLLAILEDVDRLRIRRVVEDADLR